MRRKRFDLFSLKEDKKRIISRVGINEKGKINIPYFVSIDLLNDAKCNMESEKYLRAIRSDGMCLDCGEIDWSVFQSHHIDKEKMPNFKITLCANCHQRLHFYTGRGNSKYLGR